MHAAAAALLCWLKHNTSTSGAHTETPRGGDFSTLNKCIFVTMNTSFFINPFTSGVQLLGLKKVVYLTSKKYEIITIKTNYFLQIAII